VVTKVFTITALSRFDLFTISLFGKGEKTVVRHERPDLIAGQESHFPVLVSHYDTHAVRVRVGPDDDIGTTCFSLVHSHLECFGVFRIRGFHGGEGTVLDVLGGNSVALKSEAAQDLRRDRASRSVNVRKDNLEITLGFHHGRIEQQGLEASEIDLIHFLAERENLTAFLLGHGFVAFPRDRFDLRDDRARFGFDDLRSVAPVDFEAVVVRRVVARREDDPRGGAEVPHCKAEMRGRTRMGKKVDIDPVLRRDAGDAVGEFLTKIAGVTRECERGTTFSRVRLQQMPDEAESGTGEIVKVHVPGSYAGEFRPFAFTRAAAFRRSDNFANRPSPKTTGPESELFEKTVVQLLPVAFAREVGDGAFVEGIVGTVEQRGDVLVAAQEKISRSEGSV
jgi:hypothetical protein